MLTQFKAPKTVTSDTKYPNTVEEDFETFKYPRRKNEEENSTEASGTPTHIFNSRSFTVNPLRSVGDRLLMVRLKILGAW